MPDKHGLKVNILKTTDRVLSGTHKVGGDA